MQELDGACGINSNESTVPMSIVMTQHCPVKECGLLISWVLLTIIKKKSGISSALAFKPWLAVVCLFLLLFTINNSAEKAVFVIMVGFTTCQSESYWDQLLQFLKFHNGSVVFYTITLKKKLLRPS